MENCPNQSIINLLRYRETTFETQIKLGRVGLMELTEYRELAKSATEDNILAEYLPRFSMCLLDKFGARGSLETAFIKELQTL